MAPAPNTPSTASEHREEALRLADYAKALNPASPRAAHAFAEAQLHATLALSAPPQLIVPELSEEDAAKLRESAATAPLVVLPETDAEEAPQAAPKPRRRRSSKKDADETTEAAE